MVDHREKPSLNFARVLELFFASVFGVVTASLFHAWDGASLVTDFLRVFVLRLAVVGGA